HLPQQQKPQITKIHQPIPIIQFKLQPPIIKPPPTFHIQTPLLLQTIHYHNLTPTLYPKTYPLQHTSFQTLHPNHPTPLTQQQQQLIHKLLLSLQHSQKLKPHITFLIQKPKLYLPYNPNLLIHPSIPLNEDPQIQS
ncbi:fructose-bisphosphatase class III, partial [Staphylococcus auricularis]|uniref:fructose-bisphosphatase class III n=1 Tax=Staphylococcus auricularis TaxID=29379 RepID=UPI0012457EDE